MHRWLATALFAGLFLSGMGTARAAEVCADAGQAQYSTDYATRIAGIACNESNLWYRAFIDGNGRLASTTVAEAENARLSDGVTEAWRRVAQYWNQGGLLGRMDAFDGAGDCGRVGSDRYLSVSCRAFVVDQPWSAAFISYVMTRAGVPGFHASASHVTYVRDAYLHPDTSPYLLMDPATTRPGAGDMLCNVRASATTYGYAGLKAFFDRNSDAGLNMHCDIVVAASPGGDSHLYTVGGNVLQSVTMRVLALNRNGLVWALPQRTGVDPPCTPQSQAGCNFNRQDWVALLKLKPLPPAPPIQPVAAPSDSQPACCVNCVVGSGIPRCPVPEE